MDILGGGLVGRPAQEIGKLFDVADILVVRLGAEPADRHVLDQSPAYRADGLLGHWGAPVLGEVFGPSISRQDACFCYSPRPFPCYKLPRERFSPSTHERHSLSCQIEPVCNETARSSWLGGFGIDGEGSRRHRRLRVRELVPQFSEQIQRAELSKRGSVGISDPSFLLVT